MVKTIRVLVVVIAALAGLGSCDLTYGIFPGRLMGYEAYADLSGHIDPDHAGSYNFQIIRDSSDGTEYLVLADDNGSFGDDCVVVLNADLRVLGHYSLDQLDDMDTANPFSGNGAMVDAGGKIVVGNRRFTVGGRSLAKDGTVPSIWGFGLAIPGEPNPNFGNIYANGTAELMCSVYTTGWVFFPPELSPGFGGGTNHAVEYLGLSGGFVVLAVQRSGPAGEIYRLPQTDLDSPCDPLTCYAPSPIPTPGQIAWRTLGYTNEGFAAFRWTSNQYFRFDESGLEIGTPLDVPEEKRPDSGEQHVYGRESGWYIFDTYKLTIERRAWWWK